MRRSTTIVLAIGLASCAAPAQDSDPASNDEGVVDAAFVDDGFVDEADVDIAGDESWDAFIESTMVGIEPRADLILRAMSDFLAAADSFTFHAEISEDNVLPTGQKIQYGGEVDVAMQRPGSIHGHFKGDERHRRILIHDGKCTFYDVTSNMYAMTDVPPTLDGAFDSIFDTYGITLPLSDIVYADPYATLTESVVYGFYVGRHTVDGVQCHHLAFAQEAIDWQIWIEAGPRPLPRKIVITHKDDPASPQYTARLSAWEIEPALSDYYFKLIPPNDANEIELLPIDNEPIDNEPIQNEEAE